MRKASLSTIEFLLLCGCEVTSQVFEDGFGFYWFLPDGNRYGPVDTLQNLPVAVDDYLAECFSDKENEDD